MKKLTVLIVDDSSVMRKIVERALRQSGLDLGEVREASNGAEGLVEAQKGSLDIILSDINMPVMDGLEFLKNLASIEPAKGVPVIMITTEGGEARVVEALSAGLLAATRLSRAAARAHAVAHCSQDQMTGQYEDLYREVAA